MWMNLLGKKFYRRLAPKLLAPEIEKTNH